MELNHNSHTSICGQQWHSLGAPSLHCQTLGTIFPAPSSPLIVNTGLLSRNPPRTSCAEACSQQGTRRRETTVEGELLGKSPSADSGDIYPGGSDAAHGE